MKQSAGGIEKKLKKNKVKIYWKKLNDDKSKVRKLKKNVRRLKVTIRANRNVKQSIRGIRGKRKQKLNTGRKIERKNEP